MFYLGSALPKRLKTTALAFRRTFADINTFDILHFLQAKIHFKLLVVIAGDTRGFKKCQPQIENFPQNRFFNLFTKCY